MEHPLDENDSCKQQQQQCASPTPSKNTVLFHRESATSVQARHSPSSSPASPSISKRRIHSSVVLTITPTTPTTSNNSPHHHHDYHHHPHEFHDRMFRGGYYQHYSFDHNDDMLQHHVSYKQYISFLVAALMLSSSLACVAGLDAKVHCRSHQIYEINQLFDDDSVIYAQLQNIQQEDVCNNMFRYVMLPVTLVTLVCGMLTNYCILYCNTDGRRRRAQYEQQSQQSPEQQQQREDESGPGQQHDYNFTIFWKLLFITGLVLLAWVYGIVAIMLRPRRTSLFRFMDGNSNYNTSGNSNGNNPNQYQSLAAVDAMGHVGDNANLFYLSWISMGLSLTIFYQVATESVRQCGRRKRQQQRRQRRMAGATDKSDKAYVVTSSPSVEATIATTRTRSWEQAKRSSAYKEESSSWYHSMYRLRIRSGIWVAALLACSVVLASSLLLWRDVLAEAASKRMGRTMYFRGVCVAIASSSKNSYNSNSMIPPELCVRTAFSITSGGLAACLCITAIVIHMSTRHGAAQAMWNTSFRAVQDYVLSSTTTAAAAVPSTSLHPSCPIGDHHEDENNHCSTWCSCFCCWGGGVGGGSGGRNTTVITNPIRKEFGLSVILSVLLGLNAVFATGVQGPAATVGNLYYASWMSFLLCLRILLGCMEEMYELHHEEQEEEEKQHQHQRHGGRGGESNKSTCSGGRGGDDEHSAGDASLPTKSVSTDAASNMNPDLFDNERARRSRRYLFLGIVSSICSASALDAAMNQSNDLTADQWFVLVSPTVIAILCVIQFAMCLGPISYLYVSSNLIGFPLALFMFVVWLVDLIITMHSENSWAVNAIGDIKIANLYYFSWASIVTAGLNLSTFVVNLFGIHGKDYVTVFWMAIVKVNFVILGASFHIWYTIRDSCTLDDIQASAIDFCSRTVFAIVVSLVGMAIGGMVAVTRVLLAICCPMLVPFRIRSHVEMIVSAFLVLVFGVALALITGIGGPGQSVGDLFYASWLAFLVSIGLVMTCHAEISETITAVDDNDIDAWHGRPLHPDTDVMSSSSDYPNVQPLQEPEANFVQMT